MQDLASQWGASQGERKAEDACHPPIPSDTTTEAMSGEEEEERDRALDLAFRPKAEPLYVARLLPTSLLNKHVGTQPHTPTPLKVKRESAKASMTGLKLKSRVQSSCLSQRRNLLSVLVLSPASFSRLSRQLLLGVDLPVAGLAGGGDGRWPGIQAGAHVLVRLGLHGLTLHHHRYAHLPKTTRFRASTHLDYDKKVLFNFGVGGDAVTRLCLAGSPNASLNLCLPLLIHLRGPAARSPTSSPFSLQAMQTALNLKQRLASRTQCRYEADPLDQHPSEGARQTGCGVALVIFCLRVDLSEWHIYELSWPCCAAVLPSSRRR